MDSDDGIMLRNETKYVENQTVCENQTVSGKHVENPIVCERENWPRNDAIVRHHRPVPAIDQGKKSRGKPTVGVICC